MVHYYSFLKTVSGWLSVRQSCAQGREDHGQHWALWLFPVPDAQQRKMPISFPI